MISAIYSIVSATHHQHDAIAITSKSLETISKYTLTKPGIQELHNNYP